MLSYIITTLFPLVVYRGTTKTELVRNPKTSSANYVETPFSKLFPSCTNTQINVNWSSLHQQRGETIRNQSETQNHQERNSGMKSRPWQKLMLHHAAAHMGKHIFIKSSHTHKAAQINTSAQTHSRCQGCISSPPPSFDLLRLVTVFFFNPYFSIFNREN